MPAFNESQLEQAFVELFKKEGYDYIYGRISVVIHEMLFSTMICAFICGKNMK